MDEEVCSALEAAEEARALLPALLGAFDNHQVILFGWCGVKIVEKIHSLPPHPDKLLQRAAGPSL